MLDWIIGLVVWYWRNCFWSWTGIKRKSPGTKIILTEPENAALIGSELSK